MYTPEGLAGLSDEQLKNLAANVKRLSSSGTSAQILEAERLTPMIVHEQGLRHAAKPAPVRKAPAKKVKPKV